MAAVRMHFPASEEAIRDLRTGDEVTVDGHIIGIRDRSQIRIFDQGIAPPMDLRGAFLLHTAPGVRKLGLGKYEKICIGTTTSARMVRFTEGLGAQYGVRAICGKGGLPDEAIEPMRKYGMVYLDRKSTRLNSSHLVISYAVFCLKKKRNRQVTSLSYCALE